MVQDEDFLKNSQMIYNYILKNPGLHLRKISRGLKIHLSTLRYHLDYLEDAEVVTSKKEKNLRIYFAADRLSVKDKNITSLLQQKRFRDIILQIALEPGLNHSEICAKLSLKPSTLSKYLGVLMDQGVVVSKKNGRTKSYWLQDEKKIMELLLTYKRSFWDAFVDNVLEIYFES